MAGVLPRDACPFYTTLYGKGNQMNERNTENMGIQLLAKGRKGIFHIIFSRIGLIILLLVVQVALLVGLMLRFQRFIPHYVGAAMVLNVMMVLFLFNSRANNAVKLTWLVVITVLPVFGALLYIYTQSDLGHRALKDVLNLRIEETKGKVQQDASVAERFAREAPDAAGLARYLLREGFPVFDATQTTYFPTGEAKFETLLRQLEKAEKFIFLEYFIIDEGMMWGRVLEILARKAAEGVEVRVMYDGTCEFALLPHSYPEELEKLGIQCRVFAPLTPFVSTHYNYRDHRKILVIDGKVAFTGGVNLADEYINRIERFGHWKDTAVMVEGAAVQTFTLLFLQLWSMHDTQPEIDRYLGTHVELPEAEGYVIPYGDCPLDSDKVGEQVYIDLLNRAQRYVHIMTPYLILDGEMEAALKFAAERGVEVVLILPGIPDKKLPYALAKTHYCSLMDSGVKIYEYVPGFVHAKVFVSDDREAVVGTINLDYRSLYHHFECASYMFKTRSIPAIERDVQETLHQCRAVTYQTVRHEKLALRLCGFVLKALAPLL